MSINNIYDRTPIQNRGGEIPRPCRRSIGQKTISIVSAETSRVRNGKLPPNAIRLSGKIARRSSSAISATQETASATLESLSIALESGRTSSAALVESCLAAIHASGNDGRTTFIQVNQEKALQVARAMDSLRKAGAAPSRFAGIPLSIKDVFDVEGEISRAGSKVRAVEPPASRDAIAVSRLRRMGFVLIGRTNMSEFAYSGLGLNSYFGTPRAVWDRATGRAPGGSSSGAALSVANGMAHAAIATDTGGSCRIPAAFNRLVGFKPTADRVPRGGIVPLSTTLDSVGSLARSVTCCTTLDEILSGEPLRALPPREIAGLRLALPTSVIYDGMEADVARVFESFVNRLERAGARITELSVPEFVEAVSLQATGGIATAESYAFHRQALHDRPDDYDPRVAGQIERGAALSAADYLDLVARRMALIELTRKRFDGFDAVVLPTVAIVPPPLAVLRSDEEYTRLNRLALRNPSIINLIDGCAVSLPIGEPDDPPVGATIAGLGGADRSILAIAAAVEALLAPAELS